MIGIETLLVTIAFVTALGLFEAWRHRRNLARIPIRVHVNGTRGKSSVTRLIAAGLREGGITTVAKTTGTLPRIILPDGSEQPVHRPSRANVIEQVAVAGLAARHGAEVLVLECMALQPWLQWISESRLVRATHGVITNARADHLDVMGPAEEDVAAALANMTPRGGKLFTCERKQLAVLHGAAKDRDSEVVAIAPADVAAITEDEMEGFSHVEHPDNVALALRVCEELAVDRQTALRGMWRATPDPGAMTVHDLRFFGRRMTFVSAFAANDPESTECAWRRSLEQRPEANTRIALVNCRADRPERSWQLGDACARWPAADYYALVGSGVGTFHRAAVRAGVDASRIVPIVAKGADQVFESVVDLMEQSAVIVGMGNIGELGLEIVRYFRNRATVDLAEPAPEPAPQPAELAVPGNRLAKGLSLQRFGKPRGASNGRAKPPSQEPLVQHEPAASNGKATATANGRPHA